MGGPTVVSAPILWLPPPPNATGLLIECNILLRRLTWACFKPGHLVKLSKEEPLQAWYMSYVAGRK